jgi:hypothetical protein
VLNPDTFNYLQPNPAQINRMQTVRDRFSKFVLELEGLLPDGPDRTYIIRHLREAAMWANVAITRLPDGTPRTE